MAPSEEANKVTKRTRITHFGVQGKVKIEGKKKIPVVRVVSTDFGGFNTCHTKNG